MIEKSEQERFLRCFSEYSVKSKVITISGSLPKGVPERFYEQLLDKARGVPVLLDTKGSLLKKVLASGKKPYLINQSMIPFLLRHLLIPAFNTLISSKNKYRAADKLLPCPNFPIN